MSNYVASCYNLSDRILNLEKQILEREHEMCAAEAKISYEDLISVHEKLVEHENKYYATTSNGYSSTSSLATDMRETHLKTTNLKIKLAKIISSFESKSSPEARVSLDSLFQKRESLVKRMSLLEPKEDLSPEKAEVMSNHLNSLYESFNSNQTEIESQVSGGELDSQMEIFQQIQNQVIELQTKFKKIFAPIELSSSSTPSEALQSEQIKSSEFESSLRSIELKLSNLTELLESRSSRDGDNSELSKDIEKKIGCLQATLNKFVDGNEQREINTVNMLAKILESNGRLEQDYKTKTLKSESNLRAIELKLSELVTLCRDLPHIRSDGHETRQNVIKISTSSKDYVNISKDIQAKVCNLLASYKYRR